MPLIAPRWPRLAGNLLLALGSVALVVLLTEAVFRVFRIPVMPNRPTSVNLMESLILDPHPFHPPEKFDPNVTGASLYRYRPRSFWASRYPDNPRNYFDGNRMVVYRMNAQGYRDEDFVREKAPGEFRVAAVGDSFTFGEGVWPADTWPEQLEKTIVGRHPGSRVLNFGINGYGTDDEVAVLERDILPHRPDVVVWGFLHNDISHYELDRFDLQAEASWNGNRFLRSPLRSVAWTAGRLWHLRLGRQLLEAYEAWYGDPELYDRMILLLRRARQDAEAAGSRFLVVLLPDPSGLERRRDPFAPFYDKVRRSLDEAGIPWVDLADTWRAAGPKRLRVHPIDAHPNEVAHRLAADEIAAALDRLGWLPREERP